MQLATLDIRDRIATLALNRPEQRNALSIDLIAATRARVDELAGLDTAPSAVVLRGEGRAFCAGMDLKAVLGDAEAPAALLGTLGELTLALRALPSVVVARVHGAAIGGGCGLTCVADISLTHHEAKVGFPEVDLGVCPAVVAPWVVRKMGAGRARAALLRGGLMSGEHAADIGLIDQSFPTIDALDEGLSSLTDRLSSGGPLALRATKALLNDLDGSGAGEQVRRGAEISSRVVQSDEAQASLRARFGQA